MASKDPRRNLGTERKPNHGFPVSFVQWKLKKDVDSLERTLLSMIKGKRPHQNGPRLSVGQDSTPGNVGHRFV